MLKLELLCCGRIFRLRVGLRWRRSWLARCGGALVAECGPVAVQVYYRRIWWERP
jgi:hypothetical protein